MDGGRLTIDEVLVDHVGQFGNEQKRIFLLSSLIWMPAAFVTLCMSFAGTPPRTGHYLRAGLVGAAAARALCACSCAQLLHAAAALQKTPSSSTASAEDLRHRANRYRGGCAPGTWVIGVWGVAPCNDVPGLGSLILRCVGVQART